jgi:hypothetical protein
MNEALSVDPSEITASMSFGIPLIPLATLMISEGFLWLYRRAVVRAMAAQRQGSAAEAPVRPPATTVAGPVALVVRSMDEDSIGDRFLCSNESIKRALAHLDTDPGPDGRCCITNFICRDHAWQRVFGRLAGKSDAVLMDRLVKRLCEAVALSRREPAVAQTG